MATSVGSSAPDPRPRPGREGTGNEAKPSELASSNRAGVRPGQSRFSPESQACSPGRSLSPAYRSTHRHTRPGQGRRSVAREPPAPTRVTTCTTPQRAARPRECGPPAVDGHHSTGRSASATRSSSTSCSRVTGSRSGPERAERQHHAVGTQDQDLALRASWRGSRRADPLRSPSPPPDRFTVTPEGFAPSGHWHLAYRRAQPTRRFRCRMS